MTFRRNLNAARAGGFKEKSRQFRSLAPSTPTAGPSRASPEVARNGPLGQGFALPADLSAGMQRVTGYSFSNVRIHNDMLAEHMANAFGARAFTIGSHVAFGSNQYRPQTRSGQELIAHELVHVVQQAGAHRDAFHRRKEGISSGCKELIQLKAPGFGRRLTAMRAFRAFIKSVSSHGLPTRFLNIVARNVSVSESWEDAYDPWFNSLTLESDTIRQSGRISPGAPFGESTAIQTIYHEATHAILDISSDDPRFAAVIAASIAHYARAPLRGGGTADDPERVFQEAAASYVGHRVASWYLALEMLSGLAASSAPFSRLQPLLRNVESEYNRAMRERTFGYQETGGFLGIGTRQVETIRTMPPSLRRFLDSELLEDRIPDRFGSVSAFFSLVSTIRSK